MARAMSVAANILRGHVMAHVTKEETWARLDIDTDKASIIVIERWKYNFLPGPDGKAWTTNEQKTFHAAVFKQVTSTWNYKWRLDVRGTAPFARKHKHAYVNFDIRRVDTDQHWTVDVRKMPPGSNPTSFISNVDRPALKINLDSADLDSYTPTNDAGKSHKFRAVPHEFGHTFPGVEDEYIAGAADLADTNSIMNIGNEIRSRHLKPILDSLNTMIPDCEFRP